MLPKITLAISILLLLLVMAWSVLVAHWWGGFGGPDDMPPAGFWKTFAHASWKAAGVYGALVWVAVVSAVAVFRSRRVK